MLFQIIHPHVTKKLCWKGEKLLKISKVKWRGAAVGGVWWEEGEMKMRYETLAALSWAHGSFSTWHFEDECKDMKLKVSCVCVWVSVWWYIALAVGSWSDSDWLLKYSANWRRGFPAGRQIKTRPLYTLKLGGIIVPRKQSSGQSLSAHVPVQWRWEQPSAITCSLFAQQDCRTWRGADFKEEGISASIPFCKSE